MRHAIALVAALLAPCVHAGSAVITPFGTAADGTRVDQVTLENDAGMRVRLSARGATILEIQAPDRQGKFANVVLTRADFAGWDQGGSFNAIVGRFANRIGGGGFTLDGQFHALPANPQTKVTLHGGPNGFGSQVWTAETRTGRDGAGVTFRHKSPDGFNGFPGELTVAVTYTLTERNVLRIEYQAETTRPTVINLTNHAYFTLGGHASGPVYGQSLQVLADHYTPTDERQIPTGEIAAVDGTPFDLRKPRLLREALYSTHPQMRLARGLDHNFVLPGGVTQQPRPAARLHDPVSGRQLEVRTTEPGVQVYTGNSFNGGMLAEGGRTIRQSDGVALETQHYPDSPNQPRFPSTVLRPGETFRSVTEFAFSTDRTPLQ